MISQVFWGSHFADSLGIGDTLNFLMDKKPVASGSYQGLGSGTGVKLLFLFCEYRSLLCTIFQLLDKTDYCWYTLSFATMKSCFRRHMHPRFHLCKVQLERQQNIYPFLKGVVDTLF